MNEWYSSAHRKENGWPNSPSRPNSNPEETWERGWGLEWATRGHGHGESHTTREQLTLIWIFCPLSIQNPRTYERQSTVSNNSVAADPVLPRYDIRAPTLHEVLSFNVHRMPQGSTRQSVTVQSHHRMTSTVCFMEHIRCSIRLSGTTINVCMLCPMALFMSMYLQPAV